LIYFNQQADFLVRQERTHAVFYVLSAYSQSISTYNDDAMKPAVGAPSKAYTNADKMRAGASDSGYPIILRAGSAPLDSFGNPLLAAEKSYSIIYPFAWAESGTGAHCEIIGHIIPQGSNYSLVGSVDPSSLVYSLPFGSTIPPDFDQLLSILSMKPSNLKSVGVSQSNGVMSVNTLEGIIPGATLVSVVPTDSTISEYAWLGVAANGGYYKWQQGLTAQVSSPTPLNSLVFVLLDQDISNYGIKTSPSPSVRSF
jgi:hypothetical protein